MSRMYSEKKKNRKGTDNLYTMKEIIDRAKRENRHYYCAFLDIDKVYDTVYREVYVVEVIEVGAREVQGLKTVQNK